MLYFIGWLLPPAGAAAPAVPANHPATGTAATSAAAATTTAAAYTAAGQSFFYIRDEI